MQTNRESSGQSHKEKRIFSADHTYVPTGVREDLLDLAQTVLIAEG